MSGTGTQKLLVTAPVWVSGQLEGVRIYEPFSRTWMSAGDIWAQPGQTLEVPEEHVSLFQLHSEPVDEPTRDNVPPSDKGIPEPRTTQAPPATTTEAPDADAVRRPRKKT